MNKDLKKNIIPSIWFGVNISYSFYILHIVNSNIFTLLLCAVFCSILFLLFRIYIFKKIKIIRFENKESLGKLDTSHKKTMIFRSILYSLIYEIFIFTILYLKNQKIPIFILFIHLICNSVFFYVYYFFLKKRRKNDC